MADGDLTPSSPPTKGLEDLVLDIDSESSPREDGVDASNSDIPYQDYHAHEESFSGSKHKEEFHGLGSGTLELSAELTGRLSRSASIESLSLGPITLDRLPPELFLCICDFLDARTVIKRLSLVCKYFHEIIHEDVTWKLRISKRLQGKVYPPIPVGDSPFDWKDVCIKMEEEHRMWSGQHQHFTLSYGLYASVDAVCLMKDSTVLATGSRDRNLNIWDLTKLDENKSSTKDSLSHTVTKAHKGWIWTLSSLGSSLCSGSWDMRVKLWDLNQGAVTVASEMKCKSAILSLHYEESQIIAGGFDAKLYFMDPRTSQVVDIKRLHKKPVLCIAADQHYLLTGSEDGKICVFDRRAHKLMKSEMLPEYPMALSYGDRQLWVGDKTGCLHLYDGSYGNFDQVQTNINIGHNGKVTGIHHSSSSILTSSTDKTVKVLTPTLDPQEVISLPPHPAEVAGIHFKNNVLATACSNGSVELWRPTPETSVVCS